MHVLNAHNLSQCMNPTELQMKIHTMYKKTNFVENIEYTATSLSFCFQKQCERQGKNLD